MYKNIFVVFMAVLCFTLTHQTVQAAETVTIHHIAGTDSYTVQREGEPIETVRMSVPSMLLDGRIMIFPKELIASLSGMTRWNAQNRQIDIRFSRQTLSMRVGEDNASWNNRRIQVLESGGIPPVMKDGQVMIPLRFVMELFKAKVDWDSKNKGVSILIMDRDIPPKINLSELVPLTECTEYKGYSGGLYTNGNVPDKSYMAIGLDKAAQIAPLNSQGEPDKDGKIVFMSVGMSNTTMEFSAFKAMADADADKKQNLVIVDGAIGGMASPIIRNPDADYWRRLDQRLSLSEVTPKQVQAIWLKEAVAREDRVFPENAKGLQADLKEIVDIICNRFPNIKIIYLSSRIYAGGAKTLLNPEPHAYEGAFAIKWLIEENIKNNDKNMPWIAWGPYLWANGSTPRADGLTWEVPEDFNTDGTHPSETGRKKVAKMLLDFVKTDKTAKIWFLSSKD